ncbi:hypothetical protein IPC1245_32015 [Pseudomonas aeruginosa]|nr:hypothetical protein IPC1245_32015 [Pseudomonas aeruginosa]
MISPTITPIGTSISQADDMVLQEKLMKRLNEIEQTLTQYPETERRKLALEQLQREAQTP